MDQLKDIDKKADEDKWERQFTTYLVDDTKEKGKPWYFNKEMPDKGSNGYSDINLVPRNRGMTNCRKIGTIQWQQ